MMLVHRWQRRRGAPLLASLCLLCSSIAPAPAAEAAGDARSEIEILRAEVGELRRRDAESRARLEELERLLRQVLAERSAPAAETVEKTVAARPELPAASSPDAALDRALAEAGAPAPPASAPTAVATPGPTGDVWASGSGGAAQARLVDLSLVTLAAGGASTGGDAELADLQMGAHDPDQNGFTLQQVELSFAGAVDPFFTGEAHIVGTLGGLELEEAFFTTTGLPFGLQAEAGYFFTEFGLLNPTHPHAWDWIDQPLVIGRMFGGEGLRSPGVRLGWLLPTPFFSELHVGLQNADEGELTASFMGEEGVGGRPNVARDVNGLDDLLWLGRWNAAWDLSEETALLVGASALFGPNSTGADGRTHIYGADAKVRWRPHDNFRGWPFLLWQTEAIRRDFRADGFVAGTDVGGGGGGHEHGDEEEEEEESEFPNDLAADTLHDTGLYTQLVYGFRYGWAAGLRYEYATGDGDSVFEGLLGNRSGDPGRDDRHRLSPLLVWHPTEFSRLRLQYDYDRADHLDGNDAHTVWLGGEVLYGKHAAHKY